MTAYPNKMKVVGKMASKPTAPFATDREAKGDPATTRGESPGAANRRRIDLAHLQIMGNDAVSLATAMKVVGTEPSGESPRGNVRMPTSQVTLVEGLGATEGDTSSPASSAEGGSDDPTVQVMLQLHRERGEVATRPKPPLAASPLPEVRHAAKPRHEPAPKAEVAGNLDPCLVRLIAVWPRLPQKIRDAIAAIVNSMEHS